MPDTAPRSGKIRATLPAAAAGAVYDQTVGAVDFDGTVTSVKLTLEAAMAATATNFRTFRLVNKGQAGVGTTVVASLASDVNAFVAFDEKSLTLSVVANAVNVIAGDVLAMDEIVAGTGSAHAGYTVEVTVSA